MGGLTITYGYDSAGRRIEKAYDGQTVMKYLYDGAHIIAEYDGNNGLLHKYIYGQAGATSSSFTVRDNYGRSSRAFCLTVVRLLRIRCGVRFSCPCDAPVRLDRIG